MRKYDINIFISVIPRNDTTPTYKLKLKKLDVKDHIPLQEIVKKKKKKWKFTQLLTCYFLTQLVIGFSQSSK